MPLATKPKSHGCKRNWPNCASKPRTGLRLERFLTDPARLFGVGVIALG
jgi:hypothetical protein